MNRKDSSDAEASVAAPAAWCAPAPVRRSAVPREAEPVPAPDHPDRVLRRTKRIGDRRMPVVFLLRAVYPWAAYRPAFWNQPMMSWSVTSLNASAMAL